MSYHPTCTVSTGLCRECLRAWLDRKPPYGERGNGTPWRDFEPETCRVVAAGNGFQAVKNATIDAKDTKTDSGPGGDADD